MENSFVEDRVRAARDQLALAQGQLDAAIAASRRGSQTTDDLDGAAASLRAARFSIDEIGGQLEVDAVEAPSLRRCPACGETIRTGAALCGYSWRML